MPRSAERRETAHAAFLNLPDNVVGEILDGERHTRPRPGPKHALAASYLGSDLVGPYGKGLGGPGGWWIIDGPELHLNGDIIVPDIAGWKKTHLPKLPATPFFSLRPDWVCEVLSQYTARKDRIQKMPLYAGYGVAHIWLVDPAVRTLEVYQLEGRYWKLIGAFSEGDKVSAAPFGETTIDLAFLWMKEGP